MRLKHFLLSILVLILLVHSSVGHADAGHEDDVSHNGVEQDITDSEQTEGTKVIKALETELITLNVNASDPDKEDVLKYFFSQPFDENGVWQPGYEAAGEYIPQRDGSQKARSDDAGMGEATLDSTGRPGRG